MATLINMIKLFLLSTTFNHRAYALAMVGKFEEAVQNAEEMFEHLPEWSDSY